jgi:hypothetical protein
MCPRYERGNDRGKDYENDTNQARPYLGTVPGGLPIRQGSRC